MAKFLIGELNITRIPDIIIESCTPADIPAVDLREELAAAQEPVECYCLVQLDEAGYRKSVTGSMLWFPDAGRAGIAWGADADWTDATSPEDAVHRYQTGDMRP